MLGFLENWFGSGANPIGIDFGTQTLRMAQVEAVGNDFRLIAAASADIPPAIRANHAQRLSFLTQTVRDQLSAGFRGRRAILALPAAHMKLDRMDLRDSYAAVAERDIAAQAEQVLGLDLEQTLWRHVVVQGRGKPASSRELLVMSADRQIVNDLLNAARRGRLEVIGMNVEPKAVVDCFSHVYRRVSDSLQTICFVDVGSASTRAIIARGGRLLFAQSLPIGGDRLCTAWATACGASLEEARLSRIRLQQTVAQEPDQIARRAEMEAACRACEQQLVAALNDCLAAFAKTGEAARVDRLICIGSEARDAGFCTRLAEGTALAGQVGDPLVRMGRISNIGVETGIDRRQAQPGWAVAIGLSMGPSPMAADRLIAKAS